MGPQKLDISWEAIIKVLIGVSVFLFLFSIQEIIVWFIFAVIISVLFDPAIDYLQKKKVPRVLGAILTYLAFFGAFSVAIYLIIPIFAREIGDFVNYLPQYFARISPPLDILGFQPIKDIQDLIGTFGGNLNDASSTVLSSLFSLFGGVLTTLFVITTALFLSIEDNVVEKALMLVLPKRYEAVSLSIWTRCQKRVVGWFVSRILSCVFVGIASYLAFIVLRVDYPFTMALFAGVFNFVPYVGPLITGAMLVIILSGGAISKIIIVLVAFALIQKIEGAIVSPILTKKIVGIPSSVVIISLVIGGELWGVMGAILVIPLVGVLYEFFREFMMKRREKESVLI